jgi:hypothetical protein
MAIMDIQAKQKKEPSKVEQPYLQARFNQGPLEIGLQHQTQKTKKTKKNDALNWSHWIY